VYDRENSAVPGESAKKKRKMMARFRCGDEKKRENKYWMEGEQRRYRMCYEEREMLEHTWNGCSEMIERERKEREKNRMKAEGR
jgi:hypothetical protein